MGADYYARLVVGVPVKREDFWQAQGAKRARCTAGHKVKPGMKFCPECGGRVKEETEEFATAVLLALQKNDCAACDGHCTLKGYYDCLLEQDHGGDSIGLFNLANYSESGDRRTEQLLLGRELCSFGSNDGGGNGQTFVVTEQEAQDLAAEFKALAAKIGLADRPVYFLPVLHCSV